MPEIVVQRGTTVLPASTTSVDVPITLTNGDVSKAFVVLTSTNGYVAPDGVVTTALNTDLYSAAVYLVDATTLRVITQSGGTSQSKRVQWEIWEYTGIPGGRNEFIVRQQSTQQVTGVGGAVANPWPMNDARKNIIFFGGIVWEGTGKGQANIPNAGRLILQCDRTFGINWFRFIRGTNSSTHLPRAYYTAVEFTGSNWTHKWQNVTSLVNGVPTAVTWNGGGNIVNWNKVIIHAQRRSSTNYSASQGMSVWHGTSTSNFRYYYEFFSSVVNPWDSLYVNALYNPEIDCEHTNTFSGATAHPAKSGQQTVDVATSGVVTRRDRTAVRATATDAGPAARGPNFVWDFQLQDNGSGGNRVRWYRSSNGNLSQWTQCVINLHVKTAGTWNPDLGPAKFLQVLASWTVPVARIGFTVVLNDPEQDVAVLEATLTTNLADVDLGVLLADPAQVVEAALANLPVTLLADSVATTILEDAPDVLVTDDNRAVVLPIATVEAKMAGTDVTVTVVAADQVIPVVVADLPVAIEPATIEVTLPMKIDIGTTGDTIMPDEIDLGPVAVDLTFTRADNTPFSFTLKDSGGTAIDITGYSFTLTVDPAENPPDATGNLFSLAGVLTDPTNGVVQFQPTTGNMDLAPATYYYDVEWTTGASKVRTIIKGQFIILQDISK